MKSRFRALWLLSVTAIFIVLAVGCNDTLRQFIVPVPSPAGNPQTLSHGVILSTNPAPLSNGSDTHIDTSGDSNAGVVPVGQNPIFLGKAATRAFVIDAGDVSQSIPPTVSIYTALLPLGAAPSIVTLPTTGPGAVVTPVAGSSGSTGDIYIANRDSDNVSVISSGVLAVTTTVPLPAGSHPVMIAGNAANNKVFVINNGDGVSNGTVTEISTLDNTITNSFTVGVSPIWGVMSTDGLFVFVVNQGDNTVSVIDTSLDAIVPCTVGPSCPSGNAIVVGPSPNFAFYEPKLKRVYVSNTGNSTVSVIAANGINSQANPPVLPVKLKDVLLTGGTPTSVTALSDGTKAYAALGNCPTGVNHTTIVSTLQNAANCTGNQVAVIDANALQQIGAITVGPGAIAIDSSPDASKVFVVSARDITIIRDNVHAPNCTGANCLPGPPQPDRPFNTASIYVIPTDTNVPLVTPVDPSVVSSPLPTFHVPPQNPLCVPAIDPNFNNKVPQPCALQTPFVVRTFP